MGNDLLLQAFENFRKASFSLERVHGELNQKVLHLSRKLEEKNRELERNLSEKEEIRAFLDNILSNLGNGVLVMDRSGCVRVANKAFKELLPALLGSDEGAGGRTTSLPASVLARLRRVVLRKERAVEVEAGGNVYLVSATPFRPSPDTEELLVFVFQDITELRRLQEEQERQTRLAAMGEVAIQLAHEIRNPLGGMQLYLSLLAGEEGFDEDVRGWVRHIQAGLATVNYIVTNMLQFHRPMCLSPEFLNPADVLRESAALLEPVIQTRRIALEVRDDYQGGVIRADREMLKQLSMNLLRNALNAIPEEGRITLSAEGPLENTNFPGVPFCLLTVADTGVGMDEEELRRVFEPFFSAHTGGHGIGMWVSRQIISLHKGEIVVESRRGEGTRVFAYIPVHVQGDDHETPDSDR